VIWPTSPPPTAPATAPMGNAMANFPVLNPAIRHTLCASVIPATHPRSIQKTSINFGAIGNRGGTGGGWEFTCSFATWEWLRSIDSFWVLESITSATSAPPTKKADALGHPEGVPARRLTRQRAPRHGRVTLQLVIRRFQSGIYWSWLGVNCAPLINNCTASGRESKWYFGSALCTISIASLAKCGRLFWHRVRGHRENTGRNRSRHLRGDQSLRAGIYGPWPQGHSRPPARRPPRRPPAGQGEIIMAYLNSAPA